MTAVTAASPSRDMHDGPATAPSLGRRGQARWHRRAGTPVVVCLAIAVLLAVSGCGGQPAPHGSQAPRPSGRTAVTSPPAVASSTTPRSPGPTAVPAETSAPPRPVPAFAGSVSALGPAAKRRMTDVSWRPGCPVPLSDLRLLRLSYWGFDGRVHRGQLIVNADATAAVLTAVRLLFTARYPIHRMRPVEAFGGSDERSMLADNTSAFNCRGVPGSTAWSQHAYGRAVDLNPFENPEVRRRQVDPPAASAWADRSRTGPAVIHHGDAAWRAFAAVGWTWGGDWSYPLDYMHFSGNGL